MTSKRVSAPNISRPVLETVPDWAHSSANLCSERSNTFKMVLVVCPVCKNRFYSEEEYLGSDMGSHNYCLEAEAPRSEPKRNPVRTSTPIAELETNSSGFVDSVTDFFYQSWKSGLHPHDTPPHQGLLPPGDHQPHCCAPQVLYLNAVVYHAYLQPVGYRQDGTFGVLPPYWGYLGH